jgi:hypothetical protein
MLEGLTAEILEATISAEASEQVDKAQFDRIYRVAVDSGFTQSIEQWADLLEETDARRRRLLFQGMCFRTFLLGFDSAKTIEQAAALQLLIKRDC